MEWYLRGHQNDKRVRRVDDLEPAFQEKVIRMTVMGKGELLVELERTLQDRCQGSIETHCYENPYSPGWSWLTVHDWRATKDQAIRILMREWGLAAAELVVFGDAENDLQMFQLAGRAIAVDNATDEIKRYASQIIGNNHEDSVVKFILDDWRGNA
jgi:hydroxymethylpyrimidine pyrophosphatase-like HAD family hydrolase